MGTLVRAVWPQLSRNMPLLSGTSDDLTVVTARTSAHATVLKRVLQSHLDLRLSKAVPVTRPKVPVPSVPPGLLNWGVLNALNISARNISLVAFLVGHLE